MWHVFGQLMIVVNIRLVLQLSLVEHWLHWFKKSHRNEEENVVQFKAAHKSADILFYNIFSNKKEHHVYATWRHVKQKLFQIKINLNKW